MIIYIFLAIFFFLILFFWFSGFLFGAPFQSSSTNATKKMIKLSRVKKGEKVADLGSGTGKVVIEFAKKGAIVTGFEINPLLVWISKRRIKKLGLEKKAEIKSTNFWKEDLSNFDIISVFQIGYLMNGLDKKMIRDLEKRRERKRIRVISNTWKFSGRKPTKKDGHVFLYTF